MKQVTKKESCPKCKSKTIKVTLKMAKNKTGVDIKIFKCSTCGHQKNIEQWIKDFNESIKE